MNFDRFDYTNNLRSATAHKAYRSAFWPRLSSYQLNCLDLSCEWPWAASSSTTEFERLRELIESEWVACKTRGSPGRTRFRKSETIAKALRRIVNLMTDPADRQALSLRADAVERGYDDAMLNELARLDERTTVVAGQISTWYGKHPGGAPTAFACRRDETERGAVEAALKLLQAMADYARGLHVDLRLGEVPAFSPTKLFFMAGEGNRHPKHIAYFLPEDEGFKRSPFKKTYYFANTHRALIDTIDLPLARKYLDLGITWPEHATDFGVIPTLGVLAHEIGHFIHRPDVSFHTLNSADRWVSVVLQEVAADVFGLLFMADVIAPRMGFQANDVVAYHLAECLRYVDRGLGFFPDSDGMYLQLSYLAAFGVLTEPVAGQRWTARIDETIAAYRSLARVLADTVLAGDVDRSLALHRDYGPAGPHRLTQLLVALTGNPMKTIEYLQEPASDGQHNVAAA